MCQIYFTLWGLFQLPIIIELIISILVKVYSPIKLECDFLIGVVSYELIKGYLISPNDFSMLHFWAIFVSQLTNLIGGFVFIVISITKLNLIKDDVYLIIYLSYTIFYFLYIIIFINVLNMEYPANNELMKQRTITCFIKLEDCTLPKCNKIHPMNLININKVFVKSYTANNNDCPICYNLVGDEYKECQQCHNKVCKNCKPNLETSQCPVCRQAYI